MGRPRKRKVTKASTQAKSNEINDISQDKSPTVIDVEENNVVQQKQACSKENEYPTWHPFH